MFIISAVNLLVSLSNSFLDKLFTSTRTPPLDPPNGIPNNAFLNVIKKANALISSSVKSGMYRMPPFAGPRRVE